MRTKGGGHYSKYVEFVKGGPKNPMTMAEVVEKFKECVRFSARPLKQGKVNELIQLVSNLEEVDDVRKIVKLLI